MLSLCWITPSNLTFIIKIMFDEVEEIEEIEVIKNPEEEIGRMDE
jgi:hypothetical protein